MAHIGDLIQVKVVTSTDHRYLLEIQCLVVDRCRCRNTLLEEREERCHQYLQGDCPGIEIFIIDPINGEEIDFCESSVKVLEEA